MEISLQEHKLIYHIPVQQVNLVKNNRASMHFHSQIQLMLFLPTEIEETLYMCVLLAVSFDLVSVEKDCIINLQAVSVSLVSE